MSSTQTLAVPGHQVVQFLGSGARSTIWQVRDCRTGEDFALKRVIKRHSSDARFLEQAISEYDVAGRFDHPAVRKIHRIRRIKRWLSLCEVHLFMELCPGRTLQDDPPQSVHEVVRIFTTVAEAIKHINSRGFVHADMKPNNIIACPEDGGVKIIDMGQTCPIGTVKRRIQGTPDFISPEQVRRRPLDARTDVFNFGAALYWTLTRRPIPTILPKKNAGSLKVDLSVTPPEEFNERVPPPLGKLVLDCVALEPNRRPRSMNDVTARLNLISQVLRGPAQVAQEPPACQA